MFNLSFFPSTSCATSIIIFILGIIGIEIDKYDWIEKHKKETD
jgi:hypothetical protein